MRKIIFCAALFFGLCIDAIAQNKYTVSGYVKEDATGETMIGATVYIKELLKGTMTNAYGFYSLTVKEGNYTLVISYLGFIEEQIPLALEKDWHININLRNKTIETKEVTIEGDKPDRNVKSTEMGRTTLEVEKIKTLPSFMGEVDVLKTIQLLPGVMSAGEGNTGYYVRGGGPDQNLILLDEAVVYNASHLFGFFSVFNSDAIKNVTLTKGGMPAQYGGRLASVLDISMKEGNMKEYHAEGGLGFVASRLTVQGPIKKDTCSFIVSARRTFIDLFLRKPFIPEGSDIEGNLYYFYDLNTKINYRLSDKDRLFLSGYFGRDVFRYRSPLSSFKVDVPWGNATTSFRWNHLFSDKMFVNTSLIFSDYYFEFGGGQQDFEFKLFSGIRDYTGKIDFTYYANLKHTFRFGMNYIFHEFTPSNASARSGEVKFEFGDIIRQYAHDGSLY
ncbi:MAG TPA: TonB-dependent receptor, partial [Bacteroidia bacterium]|nr:TonB-dependent receptor [Bacteroidia bacterium]